MLPMYPSSEDGAPACLNMLASPRSDPSLLCKYKSGKCANRRATKRNGQLHTLCHFHRVRQNEHQRKSDRKHRMVNVAKHAKLGSLGALLATEPRRGNRRTSLSTLSPDFASDASSAPASPMDVGQPLGGSHLHLHSASSPDDRYSFHAAPLHEPREGMSMLHIHAPSDDAMPGSSHASPIHWRRNLTRMATHGELPSDGGLRSDYPMTPDGTAVGTPSGRLPPISFLTQQIPGKLDAFRSPNSAMLPFPPGGYLQGQSNVASSQASKMA